MRSRAVWMALLATSATIVIACSSFESNPPPEDAGVDAAVVDAPGGSDAGEGDAAVDSGQTRLVDVVAGETFGCALRSDGKVFCWGSNQDGAIGELGGTTDDTCDSNVPCRFTPRAVPGIDGVVQLAAAAKTVFARRSDGSVWSWGHNGSGLLGTGPSGVSFRAAPQPISGIANAIDIVAGSSTACARLGNGTVACWGQNFYGMLLEPPSFVVQAPTIKSELANAKAIGLSMTAPYGCMIASDDKVKCWGQSSRGILGYPPVGDGGAPPPPPPGEFDCGVFGPRCLTIPVAIGNLAASSIATGHFTTCATAKAGGVLCWGSNEHGALGNKTFDTEAHPTPAAPSDLPADITRVSGSSRHVCAVTSTGLLHCWGRNDEGEAGNGLLIDMCGADLCLKSPTQVGENASRVSAGKGLTVVLSNTGTALACGTNSDARLGHPPGGDGDVKKCDVSNVQRCNGTLTPIKFP